MNASRGKGTGRYQPSRRKAFAATLFQVLNKAYMKRNIVYYKLIEKN